MTIRSRMSSIMGQIGSEYLELFTLELGKFSEFHLVYTLSSTSTNLSELTWSNCMTVRFQIGKITVFDVVYPLISANTDQSAPNLVTIYMTISSRMTSITGQIR